MKISKEINEIKSKNLENLSDEELHNYEQYLLVKDSEVDKEISKWKLIYTVTSSIMNLVGVVLFLIGLFYISRTVSTILLVIFFGIPAVLFSGTSVLKFFYKKKNYDCQKLKQLCYTKLTDVKKTIANNVSKSVNAEN